MSHYPFNAFQVPTFCLFLDHELILSQGLTFFFKNFSFSLFSVELTANQKESKYNQVVETDTDDRGFKTHLNDYATSCLLNNDTEKAEGFIRQAVQVDENSLHTWCNKGVLEIAKGDLGKAKKAAFKVLELMADDTAACRLLAEIDFEYWKAETLRTEEATENCSKVMRNCLPEASNTKEVMEYLSYSLVKILVRQLRSNYRRGKPDSWIKNKLSLIEEQLAVLYNSSDYQVDAWLWLSELHSSNINEELLNEMLQNCKRKSLEEDVSREFCVNKTVELDRKSSNTKRKLAPRIAKSCLHCAYHCDDESELSKPEEQLHWFGKAVELSERFITDNHWSYMCASNAAQGLLHIWAIEFYKENEELVNRQYAFFYKKKIGEYSLISQLLTYDLPFQLVGQAVHKKCLHGQVIAWYCNLMVHSVNH